MQKEIIELEKSTKELRKIASNKDVPYEKSQEIRKEQDKQYKKMVFLKGLSNMGVKYGIN